MIEDKDLKKTLERQQKRLEELEKQNEELRNQIEEMKAESNNNTAASSNNEKISRREFLKSAGTGALGLSALALLPSASAFNIKSSNPLQYFNDSRDSNPNFKVNQSGAISGKSVDVADLVADSVEANKELKLPNQSASENKKIWVEKVDSDTSELRVRLQGNIKTITTGYNVPDSYIEDWEGGNTDKWSNTNTAFETKTSPVYEGTYSGGKGAGTTGPQYPPMYYTGSVRNPQQGDKWSYWSYWGGNSQGSDWIFFCAQSTNFDNHYEVELEIDDSNIHIDKYSEGSSSKSDSSNASMSSGNWYKVIISHGESTIKAKVEDTSGAELGSVSISDNEYTEGELGWRGHGDRYIDLIQYEGAV